jgi:hypothetical protein
LFTSAFGVVTVKFEDGSKLVGLEKLSYWPILREYLLAKLEPKEK